MMQPFPPPQPAMAQSILLFPDEIWLEVAGLVSEWQDRAALCLAHPRVGLMSIRSLQAYKDPLFAVAIALWHRSAFYVLTERLFRRYAADSKATEEGCRWLTRAAGRHGVALAFELNTEIGEWRLAMAMLSNMKLRVLSLLVRWVLQDGNVLHYEGEKGKERKVRETVSNGNVFYYEGYKGKDCGQEGSGPDSAGFGGIIAVLVILFIFMIGMAGAIFYLVKQMVAYKKDSDTYMALRENDGN